jgi:large subunit ribosomal protein L14
MKAITGKRARGLNLGAVVNAADNSGAKIVRIVSVVKGKSTKGRQYSAAISDHVKVSVRKGIPEMRKQVFNAVVVRQRKEWRRLTGERIAFADNAVVILKDEKSGDPKGTQIKGPIAKEVVERWPGIAKIAGVVV